MIKAIKNNISFAFLSVVLPIFMTSCAGQKTTATEEASLDAGTKSYTYADSCAHMILHFSLELPAGTDDASSQIREALIEDFIQSASQPGVSEDGKSQIKRFDGDVNDPQALVDYYGKAGYELLLGMAKSDYEDRMSYLNADTTMSEEDREMIKKDIPQWAFDLTVSKQTDTLSYIIYDSQSYCYYGGAHGGISGTGAMTFDKTTGAKISRFLKSDATKALQPLIRKGLLQYYKEAGDPMTDSQLSERLQIEGTIIPQPQRTPFPNAKGDSLIFTYGQYEIACYADGMPSFSLSVEELAPYLTDEAKELLDKASKEE